MDTKRLKGLASEMTGGESSDPLVAFEQWQNERAALVEVWDELQALEIINRRIQVCLDLATSTVDAVESECGMFITDKTRRKIAAYREQLGRITAARDDLPVFAHRTRPVTRDRAGTGKTMSTANAAPICGSLAF